MNNKIKQMVEDGFATKRIAKILNLPENEVKDYIVSQNLNLKKEPFSDNDIERICQLYAAGISAKQLGTKFSIDKRRVQKWADEKGELRNVSTALRFTKFNEHKFDKIDTPGKAYWLGFCYADAYNNIGSTTFVISLKEEDYDHVVKLADFVEIETSKVQRSITKLNGKEFPIATLKLYSKHLCLKMEELGCPQAKSFKIKYPKWLPEKFNSHFIRGMFDGDGSLSRREPNNEWKFSLVSTDSGCESIQKIILQATNKNITYKNISKTGNNTCELATSGNEKIHHIMTWLYQDSDDSIKLTRKYNKFLELTTQQNNRTFSKAEYRLSDETKTQILEELEKGRKITEVAELLKLHPRTISKLIKKLQRQTIMKQQKNHIHL